MPASWQVLKAEAYEDAPRALRQQMQAMFESEVHVLSRFRHPNLVRLLGYAQGDKASGKMALVYELMEGGALYQRLSTAGQKAAQPLSLLQR